MKKTTKKTENEIVKVAENALNEVDKVVVSTEKKFEKTIDPIRKSVLKKFPILFLLAVTFGVTATITGMEQMLIRYNFLNENPLVIIFIGIGVLILTGTLYKKLDRDLT